MSKRDFGPNNPHRLSRLKREILLRKAKKHARLASHRDAARKERLDKPIFAA